MESQKYDESTQILIRGIKEGSLHLVEKSLKDGASLDVLIPWQDGISRSVLGLVSFLGHAHLVAPLVAAGASVEARGSRQFTPLHHAAREQHFQVIVELIKAGADVNSCTSDKEARNSVLHISTMWKDEESVAVLLAQPGIAVSVQDGLGYTPLHVASRINSISMINRLFEAGANLHLCTVHGWTPLHIASMSGSLDAVKRLLELGLDIYAEDSEGRTPSDLADECGRSEVYWHFIKKAGQAENSTITPCQKSARRYDIENILLNWVREGADRYIPMVRLNQPEPFDGHYQDSSGYTTLHYAAELGNHKFVKVLVEDCKTYASSLTWRNQTPADLARANGHLDIAHFLEEAVKRPKNHKEAESLYFQLLETIGQGDDVRRASCLLYEGAPLEPSGQHASHALILAVTTNRRRILTLLIAAGAPITTVFQGYNILQIAWLSSNISTFIRMIITRVMEFILEDELNKVDHDKDELRAGIFSLLQTVKSDKPWRARWPDSSPKYVLDSMEQCHCLIRAECKTSPSLHSVNHLTHLMAQSVQSKCSLTTAFLLQAGGIPYAADTSTGESPLTLALKSKCWNIIKQFTKACASLYIPDSSGLLPRDLLSEDYRWNFEKEICDRETRKIENEQDKAKDDEVKCELELIKQFKKNLFKAYTLREQIGSSDIGPKAFMLASQFGLSQMAYLLLDIAHLDVNLKLEPLMGSRALHQAAAFGHADLCSLLVSRGALVMHYDKFLNTPLHLAAMFGHEVAYKQLACHLRAEEPINQAIYTPSAVRTSFCSLLHQYNVLEEFLDCSDNICECNEPGEAARRKLEKTNLPDLVEKSKVICVNFSEGEEAEIKVIIIRELERITGEVASINPVYKGELILLGSIGDNTRLHAPDEFDFNLCVDMRQNVKAQVIELEETESKLKDHPKDMRVISTDLHITRILQDSHWKNNFYTAVVASLEKHKFSDKRLSLVPPGISRTQVGVSLCLAWQGIKYPLLLISIDLVPVLQIDWPAAVHRPYLTPRDASYIYLSSIGEGMWRLSFANLETRVFWSLKPDEFKVYLTCKTLLSTMKAEPWMPKAVKDKYTWWNSRRWKIPIPSGFALKNCFLRRLEEKRNNLVTWNDDNLAKCMLDVFGLMADKELHKKTGKPIMISKKIYPYFGGEFEKAKLGEGSLEILRFLEKYCRMSM